MEAHGAPHRLLTDRAWINVLGRARPRGNRDRARRLPGKHGGNLSNGERMPMCNRCHETKPATAFQTDRSRPHGISYTCRACRMIQQTLRRRAVREARLDAGYWTRFSRMQALGMLRRLILAAQRARTAGLWRGHEGLRAYKELGTVLEQMRVPDPELAGFDVFLEE